MSSVVVYAKVARTQPEEAGMTLIGLLRKHRHVKVHGKMTMEDGMILTQAQAKEDPRRVEQEPTEDRLPLEAKWKEGHKA